MNVRLKKTFDFSTGLVYNEEFSVNYYTANVYMTVLAEDSTQQNIAYERIKYWVDFVLTNSILIADTDAMLDKWLATQQRIISLPEKPVDQIVGIMLFSKFNAMAENRFIITDLELSSDVGDDTYFIHSDNEGLGPLNHGGWWTDPSPSWTSTSRRRKKTDKIISIGRTSEWNEFGLNWDADNADEENSNTVVFANFVKDENNSL
jgi:hypothetical protein